MGGDGLPSPLMGRLRLDCHVFNSALDIARGAYPSHSLFARLSVRQPLFTLNRLPQFPSDLFDIWLECA